MNKHILPHLPKHSACTVSLDSICSQFSNHRYEMKSSCWPVSLHIWSPEPCFVCVTIMVWISSWHTCNGTVVPWDLGNVFFFLSFLSFLQSYYFYIWARMELPQMPKDENHQSVIFTLKPASKGTAGPDLPASFLWIVFLLKTAWVAMVLQAHLWACEVRLSLRHICK